MAATDSATHRQLDYIKQLAYSRGVSFIPPANRVEASKLIDQLKRQARSPRYEIDADREQTTALHGEHAPASSPSTTTRSPATARTPTGATAGRRAAANAVAPT